MYTGRVRVGGSADVRELPGLVISKISVGLYDNNAYLLRCRATGAQVLIDAAAEPERLLALVGEPGLELVITTHLHPDHWSALADVVAATGAATAAGHLDAPEIPVTTDVLLRDGDLVRVGRAELRVIEIAGHTPGSVVVIYDDPDGPPHVFTGDCLFPGGVGATGDDPVRFAALLDDVTTKLFGTLPDEAWVYPGHGHDTTIGHERPHLDEWKARGW